jgi:hypothetical protein
MVIAKVQDKGKDLKAITIVPHSTHPIDKLDLIDEFIKDYVRIYPQEVKEILEFNKAFRRTLYNQYASNEKKNIRLALMLPARLKILLDQAFPGFFDDKKNLRKFMKRFSGFCIPEKI